MVEQQHSKPVIFGYTNYRFFLKDIFAWRKNKDRFFSHAFFASKAGFQSRSFILKVMNGEKSLSRKSVFQVAEALQLNKTEKDYFEFLIAFNEAKGLEEKNYYYQKLQSVHKNHASVLLREDQYQFFYHWYNAPIREIVCYSDIGTDYKKLGTMLFPKISAKKAKDSVELLLRLNLIERVKNRYVQTERVLSTGDEVQSLAVQNFQKDNLKLAIGSLEKLSTQKEISTLTFGINEAGYKEIRNEIISFRKRLIDRIVAVKGLDRVYQLNFQLFPLTELALTELAATEKGDS